MRYKIKIILICVVALPLIAQSAYCEWVGSYIGNEIPGYEVLESKVHSEPIVVWPVTTEGDSLSGFIQYVEQMCQKGKGLALVNLRYTFSIGEVVRKESLTGKITNDTVPVLKGIMFGDCVTKVKRK